MLNFFQDISSNKFFRRCYTQVFFLHEISSNRYVHDILHEMLCRTSLIFLSAGAVGSGVTGYVANKYFTEALSERNYSKVSFVHNSFSIFLIHVKATAGKD